MTDKTKIDETQAGSENADVKKVSPTTEAPPEKAQSEIESLKAELNSVKEVLKAIESRSQLETAPQEQAQNTSAAAIKEIVASDFQKIDKLVALGRLNPQQGAILKTEVLKKAFGSSDLQYQPQQESPGPEENSDSFTEFEKSNPDFFSSESRKLVKNYLQNGFNTLSQEELSQIADLVKMVEESAIKEYEQSKARENAILETNNEAKKRLASTALMSAKAPGASGKTFTREEIGKMSPEEFRQNESEIMTQLRKGQIK